MPNEPVLPNQRWQISHGSLPIRNSYKAMKGTDEISCGKLVTDAKKLWTRIPS
jgi:hypothetical protein